METDERSTTVTVATDRAGGDDALLETRGIAKRFGAVVALRSVDLTVRAGEVHALLGANGAGKSTLVKGLSGVFPPDSGTIRVKGRDFVVKAPAGAMAAGIATVFQDPALIPDLTVEQNLRLTGIDASAVARWAEQLGVDHRSTSRELVRDLPLESLRLLDLSRALALDPEILLLDELTAALTADQSDRVFEVMRLWAERGRAVLFITHRLAEVRMMCDRATVLRDGRDVARLAPKDVSEAEIVETMLGRAPRPVRVGAVSGMAHDAPIALEARGLRSGAVVRDVSFAVRAGEILGVVALEGQGQDRLFELLSGERRADAGELLIDGEPLRARAPYDAIRRGVVLVPSDRLTALLPQRSVHENLVTPLYLRARTWFRLDREEQSRAKRSIDRLAIDTRAQKQVRRLSGGNQQKVVLGRWLAAGFRTLLCFDPTRGIDLDTKQQIYVLLRELAADGAAIVLYTSELQEIPLVCDRVLILYGGRVVAEAPAVDITEEAMLTAAHGLEGASR
jgi:ribose transport system ATP-binding protein